MSKPYAEWEKEHENRAALEAAQRLKALVGTVTGIRVHDGAVLVDPGIVDALVDRVKGAERPPEAW